MISNNSRPFTRKNIAALFLLITAGCFMIFFLIPDGCWFGSETDWYSQHMTIADYMRKNFYATGQLFPDFTGLGGGTNFFSLSYYGFLRPDILLSYLFPAVSVAFIIQGYAIAEIFAGCILLYYWLHRNGTSDFSCFVCSFFYLTANCFFQAHRQIMFVNYLPFLLLAFLCIDRILFPKKKENYSFRPHIGLVLSLFFCILHSFYFFPSCFLACILYICHLLPDLKKQFSMDRQKKLSRKIWWNYILDVSIAVSMNMFLLLPTGLAILGNKKDVGNTTSFIKIIGVNGTLDSILYSPYGCGLTVFCLYALFLAIREKKTRKLAVTLFVLLFFDIFYWILNATLYVRPKCMIPFLPLILYLTARILDGLRRREIKNSLPLALLCLIPVGIQQLFSIRNQMVHLFTLLDMSILLLVVAFFCIAPWRNSPKLSHLFRIHPQTASIIGLLLLCTTPAMLYQTRGSEEKYAPLSDDTRDYFSRDDLETLNSGVAARFDIIEHPSNNTNYVISGEQSKSTLYSSISNSSYNALLYDILRMPISIRNRVAMVADENPFQEYLMGVRYIQTRKDKVPAGYQILQEKDGHVLAENDSTLPIAYGSTSLLSEESFDKLSYPENLDTLMNQTIVSDTKGQESNFPSYQSQMHPYELPEDFFAHETSRKEQKVKKDLPETLKASTILLLAFDVDYSGAKDISITINGIRNRLSGSEAPYPNNNNTFTYMISENQDINSLKITFSQGDYQLKNITAYTIPLSALSHPGLVNFQENKTAQKQLLNGSITMPKDGYFVTSYTFSRGYTAYVDGEKVTPIQVNKAFVGFPLKKGAHEISVEFHAPGKIIGLLFSAMAAAVLILWNLLFLLWQSRHK